MKIFTNHMSKSIKISAIHHLELIASVNLTLAERRLFNYLLHHAIKKLPDQLNFSISLSQLQGVFGAGPPPLDKLKSALMHLLNTQVEFLLQEHNHERWFLTTLLADTGLNLATNTLEYSYTQTSAMVYTEPLLLERCLIQAHFSYKYSVLLYELLAKQFYLNQPDFYVELMSLRDAIRIEAQKMQNFADFNRTVLGPACEEINSYASFTVKYTPRHQGRKTIGLHFTCTSKFLRHLGSAKDVIPPLRPQLFIESPKEELAYAQLLNADTPVRIRFFKIAQRRAQKANRPLPEEDLDRPDLWYDLVVNDVLATMK